MRDLEKVVKKVTSMGVTFAEDNPVVPLIADRSTGALKTEILGEKVLSAIVECLVSEEDAVRFIDEMTSFLSAELDCVVTMSVISRADEEGNSAFLRKLKDIGKNPYPNGKVNIGMALT